MSQATKNLGSTLRLLAETSEFRHVETAETGETRFRQAAKNAEMLKLPKLPKCRNSFSILA